MNVIEVSNLSKSYGLDFSLKNINFEIEEGKVFSMLGLNGAGKTTIVKLMLDLMNADSGSIKINGIDSKNRIARNGIVFLPEKFSFFPFYTVRSAITFFGQMKGIDKVELDTQVENALNELNLKELENRSLKTLSKGQLQRVGLSNLLIGESKLLILDEPFSGLDPLGIKDLKELIKRQKAKGISIYINSHILSEMEQICDEIGIIHKGELKVKKALAEILSENTSLEDFFAKTIPRTE